EKLACADCGISFSELAPRDFSFNSPYGACSVCTGLGTRYEVDPELVVPDPTRSLADGALAPWAGQRFKYFERLIAGIAEMGGFSVETAWNKLRAKDRKLVLYGVEKKSVPVRYRNRYGKVRTYDTTYNGIVEWLERKRNEADGDWSREQAEQFMREGEFPYFVGYGMTECAPLIAGCGLGETRAGSCGYAVEGIELRIAAPDPSTGVGEVQVRGPMVTRGYFKNPDATAELFTADGWLRTGDLGALDADGYLYLRGRSKNLILGPSGENIYPEEIEHLLDRSPWVVESLVIRSEGGLTALILPDYEALSHELKLFGRPDAETKARLRDTFRATIGEVNVQLPAFSHLTAFRLMEEEFAKTATEKIKRHLYQ
ncbi:MAG: hypothetical protein B7Z61_07335, partial [Acidobacteria bacterium 37-71-11]